MGNVIILCNDMICNQFAIICHTQSFARLGRSPIADRHGTPSRCGLIPESIISAFCPLLPTEALWVNPSFAFLSLRFLLVKTRAQTQTHIGLPLGHHFFRSDFPSRRGLTPAFFVGFTVSRFHGSASGISSDSLAASSNSWQRCVMSASADPVKTHGGFLWGIPSRHNN